MSPLKARRWMGGLLSYSPAWKSPVCSRDANCLQPDTFLDLAGRAETGSEPPEAPLIPTSAASKHVRGPTLWARTESQPSRPSLPESDSLWERKPVVPGVS